MQLKLPFGLLRLRGPAAREEWLAVGAAHLRLVLKPNRQARRYVLRLLQDGSARVTIPRGGSFVEGRRFAEKQSAWLEKQAARQALQARGPREWLAGTEVLFRGEPVRLQVAAGEGGAGLVVCGGQTVRVANTAANLRPELERFLWRLASRELPGRVLELAAAHGLAVRRVAVRNQRSRWGSCSRRGTISLNWRLIQTPPAVRDYIIFHELAHLTEMNHSRRFWQRVGGLCPEYLEAERWLTAHRELLGCWGAENTALAEQTASLRG